MRGIYGLSGYGSLFSSGLTYSKAARAYYSKVNTQSRADMSGIKKEASELTDAIAKLTNKGKDTLFLDSKEYDKDDAFKAVKNFVAEYNDTVSSLAKTSDYRVKSAGNSMTRMTGIMSNSLAKVGVTVGTDGILSVDEETFKTADAGRVKNLFSGKNSYAGIVSSSASRVASQAEREVTGYANGLYGYNALLFNHYHSGMFYNGFF